MIVYTHYKTIEEFNFGYRWRTLLQFGSSWDMIGSVVMTSPGSSNCKYGSSCWIEDEAVLARAMGGSVKCAGGKTYVFVPK